MLCQLQIDQQDTTPTHCLPLSLSLSLLLGLFSTLIKCKPAAICCQLSQRTSWPGHLARHSNPCMCVMHKQTQNVCRHPRESSSTQGCHNLLIIELNGNWNVSSVSCVRPNLANTLTFTLLSCLEMNTLCFIETCKDAKQMESSA